MFKRFLSHLRQQSLGALSLFIVLGGTSYAVATGSIDSREIKNSTIRSSDIRNNDVRGKDIRAGTLGSSDVKDASLLAADFKAGQLPAGPQGLQGRPGLPGIAGTARAYAAVNANGSLVAGKTKNVVGVVRNGEGNYCVNLIPSIDASRVEAVATADRRGALGGQVASILGNIVPCDQSNGINVLMERLISTGVGNPVNATFLDGPFFVIVP